MNWLRRGLVGLTAGLLLVAASPVGAAAAATPEPRESATQERSSGSATQERSSESSAAQSRARAQAEDRAQAQAEARADAAAAAARAARAQQRAAQAAQKAQATWASHGQPHNMLIVRTTSVDAVVDGRITQRVPRAAGTLSLARLDSAVPGSWITTTDGVTRIAAALVLTPGVSLDIGGGGLTAVQLVGGATPADAASIYTGGGRLTVHDVTVSSVDPASGQPLPDGPGRPFLQASSGGRLDATNATFSDLGTPAAQTQDRAGVSFGVGSTGSLVRTTLLRNSTGVRLSKSLGVRLEGVTAAESSGDGVMLQGDQGTVLTGVRAERNKNNGVQVSGLSTDRPITGITTTGNGQFGLAVVAQTNPRISGITTQGDGTGGLQLSGDTNPTVTDFAAVDQPVGILTHVSSSNVTLDRLRITGGGRGIAVEKTTTGLALTASTIENTQTGVSIGGRNTDMRDVVINGSRSGVRVERGASAVTATAVTLNGGQDGVVLVPGTSDVVLRDLVVDGVSNSGIRTASPNAQILGGRISGSSTGIDAEAGATINGTEIAQVDVGIRARSTDLVQADGVSVSAMTSGVNIQDGSRFALTDSRVDALEAVSGDAEYHGLNNLSLPPLNVLGVIGIPLVLLALLLDQVQRFRARRGGGISPHLPPRLQTGTH